MASSPHPIFYGVSAHVIADLCGVTVRRAAAYKRGTANASPAVIRLVTLHVEGRILGRQWHGWGVHGECLFDPEGHRTTQPQLRAYFIVWQLARELARGNDSATVELDRVALLATERLKRDDRKRAVDPATVLRFGKAGGR